MTGDLKIRSEEELIAFFLVRLYNVYIIAAVSAYMRKKAQHTIRDGGE